MNFQFSSSGRPDGPNPLASLPSQQSQPADRSNPTQPGRIVHNKYVRSRLPVLLTAILAIAPCAFSQATAAFPLEALTIRGNEQTAAPRISDLPSIVASMAGKIELEATDDGREEHVIEKITQSATLNVFNRYVTLAELDAVIGHFDSGASIEVSEAMGNADYLQAAAKVPGLLDAARKVAQSEATAEVASGVEFILERFDGLPTLTGRNIGRANRFYDLSGRGFQVW